MSWGRDLAKAIVQQVLAEAISEIISIAADKVREKLKIKDPHVPHTEDT